MLLYLVRHGDPDYAGDCLTELGRQQACALAETEWPRTPERIFVSPLGRARETARPLAERLRLPTENAVWLREMDDITVEDPRRMDLAVWNLDARRLRSAEEEWKSGNLLETAGFPRRWQELREGLHGCLEQYGVRWTPQGYTATDSADDTALMFCCHLGVGLCLAALLLELPPTVLWRCVFLSPASVTTFLLERQNSGAAFRALEIGGTGHLAKAGVASNLRGLQYNYR